MARKETAERRRWKGSTGEEGGEREGRKKGVRRGEEEERGEGGGEARLVRELRRGMLYWSRESERARAKVSRGWPGYGEGCLGNPSSSLIPQDSGRPPVGPKTTPERRPPLPARAPSLSSQCLSRARVPLARTVIELAIYTCAERCAPLSAEKIQCIRACIRARSSFSPVSPSVFLPPAFSPLPPLPAFLFSFFLSLGNNRGSAPLPDDVVGSDKDDMFGLRRIYIFRAIRYSWGKKAYCGLINNTRDYTSELLCFPMLSGIITMPLKYSKITLPARPVTNAAREEVRSILINKRWWNEVTATTT